MVKQGPNSAVSHALLDCQNSIYRANITAGRKHNNNHASNDVIMLHAQHLRLIRNNCHQINGDYMT